MQENKLDSICRVGTCPAAASPKSEFGYCPVHHRVATDPDTFDQALRGKLNAILKDFAEQVQKNKYPRRNWS